MMIDVSHIKYIVGLGNIGTAYAKSPHNLGFLMVDVLLTHAQEKIPLKFEKQLAWRCGLRTISKPNTYMNLSGQAITEFRKSFSGSSYDFARSILVLHDDITLPMHQIRYKDGKENPGLGGHNGLRSIVDALMKMGLSQSDAAAFHRIRLGCNGPDRAKMELHEYVTRPMKDDQLMMWRDEMDKWVRSEVVVA